MIGTYAAVAPVADRDSLDRNAVEWDEAVVADGDMAFAVAADHTVGVDDMALAEEEEADDDAWACQTHQDAHQDS